MGNENSFKTLGEAIHADRLQTVTDKSEPAFFSRHFLDFTSNMKYMQQVVPSLLGWERQKLVDQMKEIIKKAESIDSLHP